jgi:hypothetical protein
VWALVVLGFLLAACQGQEAVETPAAEQAGVVEEAEEAEAPEVEEPEAEVAEEPEPAEVSRTVVIESLEGTVEVRSGVGTGFEVATEGQQLQPGDEIRTGGDGRALLVLDDGTQVIVVADSMLVVTEMEGTPESPITRFFLNVGDVFTVHEGKLSPGAVYEVETPEGVAAIRSSSIRVLRNLVTGEIEAQCLVGLCSFTLDGVLFELTDGEKITIPDGLIGPMSNEDFEEWLAVLEALGIEVEVEIVVVAVCGDGVINQETEACDGDDVGDCVVGCTADCYCQPFCGDGWCGGGEDASNCPADCPSVCGDGLVTGDEQCEERLQCGLPDFWKCPNCLCVPIRADKEPGPQGGIKHKKEEEEYLPE